MDIEFDEAKDAINRAKHRLSLADAGTVFSDLNVVEIPSIREIDDEERYKAIGVVGGRHHTAVFTWRGERCRVISFRPSNSKEVRLYERSRNDHRNPG